MFNYVVIHGEFPYLGKTDHFFSKNNQLDIGNLFLPQITDNFPLYFKLTIRDMERLSKLKNLSIENRHQIVSEGLYKRIEKEMNIQELKDSLYRYDNCVKKFSHLIGRGFHVRKEAGQFMVHNPLPNCTPNDIDFKVSYGESYSVNKSLPIAIDNFVNLVLNS